MSTRIHWFGSDSSDKHEANGQTKSRRVSFGAEIDLLRNKPVSNLPGNPAGPFSKQPFGTSRYIVLPGMSLGQWIFFGLRSSRKMAGPLNQRERSRSLGSLTGPARCGRCGAAGCTRWSGGGDPERKVGSVYRVLRVLQCPFDILSQILRLEIFHWP